MNRLIPLFFTLLVLLPTLTRVGVIGNYWIQFQKYSQELCINTDKPELSCNGKCQMIEELNQSDETPPFTSSQTLTIKEQPALIAQGFSILLVLIAQKATSFADDTSAIVKGMSKDVFHPPC